MVGKNESGYCLLGVPNVGRHPSCYIPLAFSGSIKKGSVGWLLVLAVRCLVFKLVIDHCSRLVYVGGLEGR